MISNTRSHLQAEGLMITLCGTRARTFRLNRWAMWAVFCALPFLVASCLGATCYFVFHDQLLASLMARQADMQYAYEDKIAALRTELDRESSRGLINRRTLGTTVQDLAKRGDQLAARAAAIDAIVAQGLRPASVAERSGGNPLLARSAQGLFAGVSAYGGNETVAPAKDLRLDGAADPSSVDMQSLGKRSDLGSDTSPQTVAELFERVEHSQAAIVDRLRTPMLQKLARQRLALSQTGLPSSRWSEDLKGSGSDVGGPFVPLPAGTGASSIDDNIAVLRDAISQQARLGTLIDRVPLRRPLEGAIEVTSTFGARVDPFLGRPAMHTGIDLHEDFGDAVESTAAGVVTVAGSEGGYGNMVEIDHGNGLSTRYAHLSSIDVSVHQTVSAGYIVGHVGSTGRATGPHLHYETRIDGQPVDPSRFLKAGSSLFPG